MSLCAYVRTKRARVKTVSTFKEEEMSAWKQLWNAVWYEITPENVLIQWLTFYPSVLRCIFICTVFTTVILYVYKERKKA